MYKIIILLLLAGCTTATNIATDAVKDQVTALEKSLTVDCKSPAINAQLDAIRTQVASLESTCEAEKETLTAKKILWQVISGVLFGIIIALTFGKLKL